MDGLMDSVFVPLPVIAFESFCPQPLRGERMKFTYIVDTKLLVASYLWYHLIIINTMLHCY